MSTQDNSKAIKDLEHHITNNHALRDEFLKDPGGVMHKHGVVLAPDQAKHIKDFIDSQLKIPNANVTGASIRPGALRAEVEVTVSVGVKF